MNAVIKYVLAGLCFAHISAACSGQTIKGAVTDSLGKNVSFAGVNLKVGGVIIAFTVTSDKGVYTLDVPADAPKNDLMVEVSSVGYVKQSRAVTDLSAPCNFKLKTTSKQLSEVTIKNSRPRVKTSGDTLSYKASDFTNPQDRVIGDVIKKLPGVDVASDGKISYNGKAISGLYLGGDNLLDDKYNIATKTIPSGSVDQIQVMENHQPIKMLKDKVVSDDVALNLTFKAGAKIKLVGQESLGAGLPGKYDEELNAMMFKDKYKAINYIKGNNTGFDLQNDLISHNFADYLRHLDNDKPTSILSLGTAGDPDLPRNRYLFNQAGIINLNNLVNIKKDVQLKANLYYLHDTQKQYYQKHTELYQPQGTISYDEIQQNSRTPDLLHGQFTLNINKDKYYLNNTLITDCSRNTGNSDLTTNGVLAHQVLKDNSLDFSNEFNIMSTAKNGNITEVYSYIDRISEPESRVIEPGLTPNVFNKGNSYAQLLQTGNVPSWFNNNYFSYKIPSTVTQSYKAGFSVQSQQLQSALNVVQNNGAVNAAIADSSVNDLSWTKNKAYAEAAYDIPGKKLKLTVGLPLTLQQLDYSDTHYLLDKSLTRLYFDPRVSGKLITGIEHYISFGYNYKNSIGNIQDIYDRYILKNYRTLYANRADLTERQTQTALLGFSYRRAITLFFWGVNAIYTHSVANNINSSIVTPTLQQRIVLPFENAFNSWTVSSSVSKYAFNLRTTFTGGVSWQSSRSNQIQNGVILPFNTIATTISTGAETKVSDQINLSYKAGYTQTTSKSSALSTSSMIQQLQQAAAINYNPLKTLFFRLSGDHYFSHQNQANDLKYFFADASAKYKLDKYKVDLELSALNLMDTKTYSALYLSANTFTSNTYTIPGRTVLLKVFFNI